MRTERLSPDPAGIAQAAAWLRAGGLVVLPTETVYGLGASALDRTAVARVYAAKGRPSDNPLIVHLADRSEMDMYAVADERARLLSRALWPGPLTLVLASRGQFGTGTIALRVPAQPIAQAIIACAGRPVAAPSANRSGRPSPTTFADALGEMDGRVEAIVEGPPADYGIESTVLDLTAPVPALLRPGAVSADEISRLLGGQEIVRTSGSRRSPGTRYRHYAPDVPVTLFFGESVDLRAAIAVALAANPRSVYIGLREDAPEGATGLCARDLPQLQAGLYPTLLEAERTGRPVLAALPQESPESEGVRDRLLRAAGGRAVRAAAGREAD